MDCACGHAHTPALDPSGTPVPLSPAPVALHGRLICHDTAQMLTALDMLQDHADASRAEPGCLFFEIAQTDDPLVWRVEELFRDAAALEAHRARTRASPWAAATSAST